MDEMFNLNNCIQEMKETAHRGCGLVYEIYVEDFSAMLDDKFPPGHPQREEAIALAEGEYCPLEEVAVSRQEAAEMGLCSHDLDPDCCPCGCGDL